MWSLSWNRLYGARSANINKRPFAWTRNRSLFLAISYLISSWTVVHLMAVPGPLWTAHCSTVLPTLPLVGLEELFSPGAWSGRAPPPLTRRGLLAPSRTTRPRQPGWSRAGGSGAAGWRGRVSQHLRGPNGNGNDECTVVMWSIVMVDGAHLCCSISVPDWLDGTTEHIWSQYSSTSRSVLDSTARLLLSPPTSMYSTSSREELVSPVWGAAVPAPPVSGVLGVEDGHPCGLRERSIAYNLWYVIWKPYNWVPSLIIM